MQSTARLKLAAAMHKSGVEKGGFLASMSSRSGYLGLVPWGEWRAALGLTVFWILLARHKAALWKKTIVCFAMALPFMAFQKKLLPPFLGMWVGKIYFWPTLPFTKLKAFYHGGQWCDVDDVLTLGGTPLVILGDVETLHGHGVRGVINMQAEYSGPETAYEKLGITQLRLPTIDHIEPSVEYFKTAVSFIEKFRKRDERVYVHCKAGHGRAAAVTMAWLAYNNNMPGGKSLQELNADLLQKRRVRKYLYKQANLGTFSTWLGEDETTSSQCNDSAPSQAPKTT